MSLVCGWDEALGWRAGPDGAQPDGIAQEKGHRLLAPRWFGRWCWLDLLGSGCRKKLPEKRGDGTGAGRRRNREKAVFGMLSFYILLETPPLFSLF